MPLPTNPVDKLIQKIKNNLGRTNDSNVNDMVLDWINMSQRQICTRINLWFMHEQTTLTFTVGIDTQPLPLDFKLDDGLWIRDSNNQFTELLAMSIEDYRRRYDDQTQAEPDAYLIRDDDVFLRAIPDKTYTIVQQYYKFLPDFVVSGTTNSLLSYYEDILEAGATMRGFRYLQEFDDGRVWEDTFERLYRDLVAENAQRELPDEMVLSARPDSKGTTIGEFKARSSQE